jgi:hypothetical protein
MFKFSKQVLTDLAIFIAFLVVLLIILLQDRKYQDMANRLENATKYNVILEKQNNELFVEITNKNYQLQQCMLLYRGIE